MFGSPIKTDIRLEAKQRLGIWMDHANAHLIQYATKQGDESTIFSKFTHEEKVSSADNGENPMRNKEQHEQLSYYKRLGEAIKKYKSVLLFGPTAAKDELLNLLHASPQFSGIQIEIKHAGKMTENQRYAFVKEHFKSN